MSSQHSRFCPFCVTALVGSTFLLVLPGLADISTPVGSTGFLLFWLPSACAALRQYFLHIARTSLASTVSATSR